MLQATHKPFVSFFLQRRLRGYKQVSIFNIFCSYFFVMKLLQLDNSEY